MFANYDVTVPFRGSPRRLLPPSILNVATLRFGHGTHSLASYGRPSTVYAEPGRADSADLPAEILGVQRRPHPASTAQGAGAPYAIPLRSYTCCHRSKPSARVLRTDYNRADQHGPANLGFSAVEIRRSTLRYSCPHAYLWDLQGRLRY